MKRTKKDLTWHAGLHVVSDRGVFVCEQVATYQDMRVGAPVFRGLLRTLCYDGRALIFLQVSGPLHVARRVQYLGVMSHSRPTIPVPAEPAPPADAPASAKAIAFALDRALGGRGDFIRAAHGAACDCDHCEPSQESTKS